MWECYELKLELSGIITKIFEKEISEIKIELRLKGSKDTQF